MGLNAAVAYLVDYEDLTALEDDGIFDFVEQRLNIDALCNEFQVIQEIPVSQPARMRLRVGSSVYAGDLLHVQDVEDSGRDW